MYLLVKIKPCNIRKLFFDDLSHIVINRILDYLKYRKGMTECVRLEHRFWQVEVVKRKDN